MVKNVEVMSSLCGSPKDIFDTPRTVLPPLALISRTVSRVILADSLSVLIVIVSASITISLALIP